MISFIPIFEENVYGLAVPVDCDEGLAKEYMTDAVTSGDGAEYAACFHSGCLLLRRFFRGGYDFVYPIEISHGADADSAVDAVCEYAVRQEVPISICAVPREQLGDLILKFQHADVDAEDPLCDSYRVRVKTLCDLIDEIPTLEGDDVVLDELCDGDAAEYNRLCTDTELCRYWGYDYREDVDKPSEEYFLENVRRERVFGTSLTFAVRYGGALVGEALLYAFDGRGGCETAVRIFPELWGKGIGKQAVSAIIEFARAMGMAEIRAVVKKENLRSARLFSFFAHSKDTDGENIVYKISLLDMEDEEYYE